MRIQVPHLRWAGRPACRQAGIPDEAT